MHFGISEFPNLIFEKIETIWPQFIQSSGARKSFDTLDFVLCCLFSGFFRRFSATLTNSIRQKLEFSRKFLFSKKFFKKTLNFSQKGIEFIQENMQLPNSYEKNSTNVFLPRTPPSHSNLRPSRCANGKNKLNSVSKEAILYVLLNIGDGDIFLEKI